MTDEQLIENVEFAVIHGLDVELAEQVTGKSPVIDSRNEMSASLVTHLYLDLSKQQTIPDLSQARHIGCWRRPSLLNKFVCLAWSTESRPEMFFAQLGSPT